MTDTTTTRYGAQVEDWVKFANTFKLQKDLLPVVSNPNRKISPGSDMQAIGKTPSVLNNRGMVSGIPGWTSHQAAHKDVVAWSRNPDYGICVVGRNVKAIDIDMEMADDVIALVDTFLGITLPVRYRSNSGKKLMVFRLAEETHKRVVRGAEGIIELLGDRQQFIAAGTHTSGSRYAWAWRGNEEDIPSVRADQLAKLWDLLQSTYGIEPERKKAERKTVSNLLDDPLFEALNDRGLIKSEGRDGSYNIVCPYEHEHTSESCETATVYYPAHTGGFERSHIKCLHAHCDGRSRDDWEEAVGLGAADLFEDVSAEPDFVPKVKATCVFHIVPAVEFAMSGEAPRWLIKNIIQECSIGSIYGASKAGKTFAVLDMVASIARGEPWRGRKVRKGRVVYICAEGAHFFRNRIKAYLREHNLTELDVYVLAAGPDLMKPAEVNSLIQAVKNTCGDVVMVVVDTYAACMVGDENNGKDVNQVLKGCKQIRDELNASVVLVHHSGKDVNRGARGWSGLHAAVDFELRVVKEDGLHAISITKQKDAPDDGVFGFKLKAVELGEDEDGEPIISCVVEHTDDIPLITEPGEKVSIKDQLVVSAINNYKQDFDMYPTIKDLISYMDGSVKQSDIEKIVRKLSQTDKVIVTGDGVINPTSGDVVDKG